MAEDTGSGDQRERVTVKRSAGVAALVAAGLAAGALAAGSLASGATADVGDPTTTASTDPGTTTTTPDPGTTDTTTTDTTTAPDPSAPPADTTPAPDTTTVDPAPPVTDPPADTTPAPPVDTTPVPADTTPAPPADTTPAAPADTAPVPTPAAPDTTPVAPATTDTAGDTSSGGGREQPPTHAGSGQAKTVVPPPPAAPPAPAQPALSARLLPTPAQIRFYVHATTTPPLPKLRTIDHDLALRVSTMASESHVHWALLAAVARVESRLGLAKGPIAGKRLPSVPAGESDQLRALATFLHEHGANRNLSAKSTQDALKAYFGSDKTAKRVDTRLHIYPGGRADIRGRRVDPRVLITVEYLANATGSVRISSLVSGHRLFTASGSVSAHVYGRAVDVTAVGGVRIKHHQGPGSVTERTVRLLLLLPQRMRPRQVVSLMDVDGPTGNRGSFALPDHSDRIQIGY
jgi:hypothetical protein